MKNISATFMGRRSSEGPDTRCSFLATSSIGMLNTFPAKVLWTIERYSSIKATLRLLRVALLFGRSSKGTTSEMLNSSLSSLRFARTVLLILRM